MKVNAPSSTSTYPISSLHMGALMHTPLYVQQPKAKQGEHVVHKDKTSRWQNYTVGCEVVVCVTVINMVRVK